MSKKLGNIAIPDDVYLLLEARAAFHERPVAAEVRIILRDACSDWIQVSSGHDAFDAPTVGPITPEPVPSGVQPVIKIVHPCPECNEPVKIIHAQLWRCHSCGAEGDNPEGLPTDRRSILEPLA